MSNRKRVTKKKRVVKINTNPDELVVNMNGVFYKVGKHLFRDYIVHKGAYLRLLEEVRESRVRIIPVADDETIDDDENLDYEEEP